MKLYLLRHGSAEEWCDGKTDFGRQLTEEGVAEMQRVAIGLSRLVGEIDLLVSSPLLRALETARIVESHLRLVSGPLQVSDSLAAGSACVRGLQSLLSQFSSQHRIMLVGHEPDFSEIVKSLTGATVEMKKAGLAFIDVYRMEAGGGVLRWLLTPRHMICDEAALQAEDRM